MTMRTLLSFSAALALSGCPATVPPADPSTKIIDTACTWVKLITTVPADTYETKQQIFAHDKAYLANWPKTNKQSFHGTRCRPLLHLSNKRGEYDNERVYSKE